MEKRKAIVIENGGDKWIVQVNGIEKPLWLFKDKANRSPIGNQIKTGVELDVETFKDDRDRWKIGKIWLSNSSKQNLQSPNTSMKSNSKFDDETHSVSSENFYLKLFKQKRLFNDNYEFDKDFNKKFQKSQFDERFVSKINRQNVKNAENLLGTNKVISNLVFRPEWRLVLGLGGSSIYETGMTLHHIYGIPYLPSTAVKGIARSYVITEIYGNEIEALTKQDFCDVFGCSGEGKIDGKKFKSFYKTEAEKQKDKTDDGSRKGKLVFFDAFPLEKIKLEADIMNPHYPDWYGKGVTPADWQNPIPIPFLTIGDETSFQFVVGVKKDEDLELLEKTKSWLESALKEKGIGAKTAVGYGYMK